MRNAETILGIIQERGKRGLPLEDLYRQLFNPDLYLLAYGRLYRNQGAMTPSTTPETVDGMSLTKIDRIIEALRRERYRWTPVRRIYIEKPHSKKMRPLGIPSWSDKLLQEVIRLLLEAYYEPQFLSCLHGFRPNRGCHTALDEIYHKWVGTKWFVEGDIAQCFDSLDHSVSESILGVVQFLPILGYVGAPNHRPAGAGFHGKTSCSRTTSLPGKRVCVGGWSLPGSGPVAAEAVPGPAASANADGFARSSLRAGFCPDAPHNGCA